MILRFTRDNNGGVLVEATIMITIMFVFVLGSDRLPVCLLPMECSDQGRSDGGPNCRGF